MRQFKYGSILLILVISLFSCGMTVIQDKDIAGYRLSQPDQTLILPEILHEVSGLTHIDATTFACIQDEKGLIFIYDAEKNAIKRQINFYLDGDYEGITKVGDTMYVLQSNGTLFEIAPFNAENFQLHIFHTGIPANDNEGLCYDPDNNRLLIASKSKIGKGSEYKDKRAVYGFDLTTKQLNPNPVFDFDLQEIKTFASKNANQIPSKTRKNNGQYIKDPFIKFRASAISIHPLTKQIFVLSATDYMLFVFDKQGKIQHISTLNPLIFNKAEGITFLDNGDMLISNEGENKRPTVLRFNYLRK